MCWRLGFETNILKCNVHRKKTQFYIILNAFIFLMLKQSRQNIIDTLKNAFISQTHVDTVNTKKEKLHKVHERRLQWLPFLIQSRYKCNSKS